MQQQRRRENETAQSSEKARLQYERPSIIYQGKISIRAGSPLGADGRFGPPGGPDSPLGS